MPADPPSPLQVVMVAGGAGTRLASVLAPGTPKILVPVQGRPFLGYVLDLLAMQGVRRLHLCLGHDAAPVRTYLEQHAPKSFDVTTSVEPRPLGNAGCLKAAGNAIDDEFLLLLGDTYTPVDLGDLIDRHHSIGAEGSMAVLHNRDWLVTSNIESDHDLVTRYDKNADPGTFEYVDYGIAILRRSSLNRIKGAEKNDLGELYQSLIDDRQLAALPVGHRFYEIGTPASYADFVQLVEAGELPTTLRKWSGNEERKKRLSGQTRFANPWMTLREDSIIEPDGSVSSFAVVTRADFVVILCELPSGELVMTQQYRYAAGRMSLELPQGEQHAGETPEHAALRELREETGWIGVDAEVLVERIYEAADWATEHFAVVRVLPDRQAGIQPDPGEIGLRTRLIRRDELPSLLKRGEICDAATLAALSLPLPETASSEEEFE